MRRTADHGSGPPRDVSLKIPVKIKAAPSFRRAVGGIEMKQEQNLTEGPVLKTLLVFTVPFIIANVIQAL